MTTFGKKILVRVLVVLVAAVMVAGPAAALAPVDGSPDDGFSFSPAGIWQTVVNGWIAVQSLVGADDPDTTTQSETLPTDGAVNQTTPPPPSDTPGTTDPNG